MELVKRDGGYAPLSQFFDDFLTRDFFGSHWPTFSTAGNTPKVNLRETEDNFVVEMAAPGMKKDDFKIVFDNDTLSISSVIENEDKEENAKYYRQEFVRQSFERSFQLPKSAEGEKIKATYYDGILKLTIPKKEEAKKKPLKTIKIS